MDVEEHFYADDPSQGPPDAKTNLRGVSYFFLGNGLVQAAVQVCRVPGATPAGLLVMDPESLGPKRRALTFDPASGIAATQLTVTAGRTVHRPGGRTLRARWIHDGTVPTVSVSWRSGPFRVEERFFCPEEKTARLVRRVTLSCDGPGPARVRVRTGFRNAVLDEAFPLGEGQALTFDIVYRLVRRGRKTRLLIATQIVPPARASFSLRSQDLEWRHAARCRFSERGLTGMFETAKADLRAVVGASGRLDGGIWQYKVEWVRDQAFVAQALAMAGRFDVAGVILARLLREFVSPEGATLDSSRFRAWQDSEFDQNGILLFALEQYVNWSGDTRILARHWDAIVRAADFPLRAAFRHSPSGLLHNGREFWERHGAYGIRDGMELAHQLFVSMGMAAAARLAARQGDRRHARTWAGASLRLRQAVLGRGRFSLVENGRLIKRRGVDGLVQREIRPPAGAGFPAGTPLFSPGPHRLEPDSSTALAVAWEFIDPAGPLARRTLAALEPIWNQRWKGGGYGRYNVTSEPDSPGPWPFPSVFIARAHFEAGDDGRVRRVLDWLSGLPGGAAGTWFEFYGPRPAPPYPQVGVVPWVWAELIFLFIHHMLGVRPAESRLRLRPRLLSGLDAMEASLRLREGRLSIAARRAGRGERPGFRADGSPYRYDRHGIVLEIPRRFKEIRVEAVLP